MLDDFTERRPYNAVSDFVDAHVSRGLSGKTAFIDPDRTLSYGELQARSVRFAHALRSLGIRQENRVALLLHDTVDYPVAFWGTVRAGSIAIPLNTFLNVAQYAYILADSRANALIAASAAGAGDLAHDQAACRISKPSSWSAPSKTTWQDFPAATCICSRT